MNTKTYIGVAAAAVVGLAVGGWAWLRQRGSFDPDQYIDAPRPEAVEDDSIADPPELDEEDPAWKAWLRDQPNPGRWTKEYPVPPAGEEKS